QRGMRSIQSKAGTGMVKGSATPICGVVALLAGCREICLCVIRAGRSVEIILVARDARRGGGEAIWATLERRGVARCALKGGMRSVQGKAGAGMVKGSAIPVRSIVALLARL